MLDFNIKSTTRGCFNIKTASEITFVYDITVIAYPRSNTIYKIFKFMTTNNKLLWL